MLTKVKVVQTLKFQNLRRLLCAMNALFLFKFTALDTTIRLSFRAITLVKSPRD